MSRTVDLDDGTPGLISLSSRLLRLRALTP
jgi:hypothetical protein